MYRIGPINYGPPRIVVNYGDNAAEQRSMSGTTGLRRKPQPIQYLPYMVHGRETWYIGKIAIGMS